MYRAGLVRVSYRSASSVLHLCPRGDQVLGMATRGKSQACVAGLLCRSSTLRWTADGIRQYHGDIVERCRLTQVVGSVSHQPG